MIHIMFSVLGRLPKPIVLIIGAALLFGFVYYGPFDFLSLSSNTHYVIIIDAGSTGSRIHVFTLKEAGSDGYKLIKDDFYPLEPGLSSYGKDPKQAAQSLKPLLDFAHQKVPVDSHHHTVVKVKATAGLRILSEEVASNILKEVTTEILHLNFCLAKKEMAVYTSEFLAWFRFFSVKERSDFDLYRSWWFYVCSFFSRKKF